MSGYTSDEIDAIQDYWGLRFPPDLIEFYYENRCFGDAKAENALDWLTSDPARIHEQIEWPLQGYWRDVLRWDWWWPEWGERPAGIEDQYQKLRAIFRDAPRLIPLYLSHLYLPAEPCEAGNPVISAHMSDVIYSAPNLAAYIAKGDGNAGLWDDGANAKPIRFWDLAINKYTVPMSEMPRVLPVGSNRDSPMWTEYLKKHPGGPQ